MAAINEGRYAGEFIGELAMGIGYHTEVGILLTGTAYQAGDVLGIVTATGKYKLYDNAAVDGSQAAAGICHNNVDATGGDKANSVIFRRGPATVNVNDLRWGSNDGTGITAGKADLLALGIKAA